MTFRRGVALFALASVAGVVGVFVVTSTPASLPTLLRSADPAFALACVLLPPVADWLLAGARLWLFTSVLSPRVSYAACVRNCAVGAFMGAATPSQTGGGLAQAYVLVKDGASVAEAAATLFFTFLSTLLFYLILAATLWGAAAGGVMVGTAGAGGTRGFLAAVAVFGALSAMGLATLVWPARARALLARLGPWLARRRLPARAAERLGEVLAGSGDAIDRIGRRHRGRVAASVALSVVVFGNKYLAGWLAARALGLHPPLGEVLLVHAFLNVLLYFFPTPGASGGAEVSAAVLMAPLVPAALLAPYAVLWRTATTYLSVLVGGFVLARYVRRDAAEG